MNIFSAIWVKIAVGIAAGLLFVAHTLSPALENTPAATSPATQISTSTEQVVQATTSRVEATVHVQAQVVPQIARPTVVKNQQAPSVASPVVPVQSTTSSIGTDNASQPAATTSAPSSGAGITPAEFVSSLQSVENAAIQNDPLLAQRQALLQQLYTAPGTLTPAQLAVLPPDIAQTIQSGNIPAMQTELQIINQGIAAYNLKISSQIQTQINTYSAENGLPITQPVPTETNCTLSSSQTSGLSSSQNSGNAQCYTY